MMKGLIGFLWIGANAALFEVQAAAKTSYLTTDHLGSPRINTDATGQVTARHDYMPFGEEIYTPRRTQGVGYTADTIRQKFTGYERDIESDLDFAQARMYNFRHGRFTAVDPLMVSADPANPQSWNRYTYCFNNPLILLTQTEKLPEIITTKMESGCSQTTLTTTRFILQLQRQRLNARQTMKSKS